MKVYRAFKECFVRGEFYGLGEEVHVHTLPQKGLAVMNVFNLADLALTKEVRFSPGEIGLPQGTKLTVQGGAFCEGEGCSCGHGLPSRKGS